MTSDNTIKRRGLGLLALTFAGLLLALAWPRFEASWRYLPVDTALAKYFASRNMPSAQLEPLVQRAAEALEVHDHYRYWEGLSLLHYLRAIDSATPVWERQPAMRRALRAARESVRRAPANPRAWLRMARVRASLGEPESGVLPPLRMSILTGRVEPTLLLARLELGFRFESGLDDEAVVLLRDQTLLAWRVDPQGFTRSIQTGRMDFARVKRLLLNREDVIAEMEARLGPPD